MSSDKAAVHLFTAEISDALLADERQQNFYHVWLAACERSGKSVPVRPDIDITELRECIGNLLMLQVEDGGRDFRYLVHGTQVARDYGQDLTGKRITDIRMIPPRRCLSFIELCIGNGGFIFPV